MPLHPLNRKRVFQPNLACKTSDHSQDAVDIAELKKLARSMLPSSSAQRWLILSRPDCLSREEVAIKVRMYSKLLYREMKVKP